MKRKGQDVPPKITQPISTKTGSMIYLDPAFMKALLYTFAMFGAVAVACVLYVVFNVDRSIRNMKPYGSYLRLMNLTDGVLDYKSHFGAWPADLSRLVAFRPDLVNDVTDGYANPVIYVPYNKAYKYGEFISYGRDGKPGGDNKYDRDIIIRFPTNIVANAQWNTQVADRFKTRSSRGLP